MNRNRYFAMSIWGLLLLSSTSAHADPFQSMAKKLVKGAKTLQHKRIAVLVFPYENGNLSSGSTLVSEELTSRLSEFHQITVIERSLLANVLGEIRLEESGITDSSGTAKPGNILPVDAVVTGTLEDHLGGHTVVNARLIRLSTGEILASASSRIEREWDDVPRPPAVLADAEPASEEPYVFHTSPMIYTPWARPVPGAVHVPDQAAYAGGERTPDAAGATMANVPAPVSSPASAYAMSPSITIIQQPSYGQVNNQRAPHDRARSQLFYAMGLTLDLQGHHRQADRFYKDVLRAAPAQSPLHQQVEHRALIPSANR